jgi:hypothetical protein
MSVAAAVAAAAGWGIRRFLDTERPLLEALLVFAAFGAGYLLVTSLLGVPEAHMFRARLAGLARRR